MPKSAPKVARAAYLILSAPRNRNPYEISEHLAVERGNVDDCARPELWIDDEMLIPRENLGETVLFCPACEYEYSLWESLLELGSSDYGERVYEAMALMQDVEEGIFNPKQVTAAEWDDVQVVKAEQHRIQAMRAWEQAQEAAAQSRRRG